MILQNPTLWDSLVQALTAGRLTMPLVIAGPSSIGKTTLIKKFCRHLWCRGGGEDDCIICRQVASGVYPDLIWLEREEGSSEIKLEQTQAMLKRLASSSLLGGLRVAVIAEAEYLNENSGNALLKYLEELPASCLFFLSTSQPSRLLPTIQSRAMYLSLSPVSPARLIREFSWDPAFSPVKRQEQICLSGGCPGFLVRWQEDEALWQEVRGQAGLMSRWWQGERLAHRELVSAMATLTLTEQRYFLQELIRLLELQLTVECEPRLNRLPFLWRARQALQNYVSPRLLLDIIFYTSL